MGFSKKTQADSGLDSEAKKWVIAGIAIRTSLKPINTKTRAKNEEEESEEEHTPTAKESRMPERPSCPPAPRKRRPASRCNYNNSVREFFTPPDLESVFKCYVEKAN
ncbi:cyclin-dependent protein kinase inhibitor SMR6 [Mercurialis annua]|uniref:cyclin-dependent protein kinase inhibitor SMR6 n=1 Tax=Mercurialis annua TaxID=3986 RepID=UPI00215E4D2E|nr:cyclin-dependent protein kinase inhibitor SMR6 [Mercurialis annua]